jgi:hypothetical protein
MTSAADDKSHSQIAEIYAGIEDVCERLRQASYSGDHQKKELALFLATVAELDSRVQFGGIAFGDATPPYDDAGINLIGQSLAISYCLADFTD